MKKIHSKSCAFLIPRSVQGLDKMKPENIRAVKYIFNGKKKNTVDCRQKWVEYLTRLGVLFGVHQGVLHTTSQALRQQSNQRNSKCNNGIQGQCCKCDLGYYCNNLSQQWP
jgi:hypothetical protein